MHDKDQAIPLRPDYIIDLAKRIARKRYGHDRVLPSIAYDGSDQWPAKLKAQMGDEWVCAVRTALEESISCSGRRRLHKEMAANLVLEARWDEVLPKDLRIYHPPKPFLSVIQEEMLARELRP